MSDIKVEKINKIIRGKINPSHPDTFQRQLNEELSENLYKMEESIIKDMKRKAILQNQEKKEIQRRSQLKKQLFQKQQLSEDKRNKTKTDKLKTIKRQKEHKAKLFLERTAEIRKKENQKNQRRIKALEEISRRSPTIPLKSSHNFSFSDEPHYKKKNQANQQSYAQLKRNVEGKKAFEMPKIHHKKLSLTQLSPRKHENIKEMEEKINKMGQHLQKIDQVRKKKEKMIEDRLKKSKSIQDYYKKAHKEKLEELKEKQQKNKSQLLQKLTKPVQKTHVRSYSLKNMNQKSRYNPQLQKIRFDDRQKMSYRRQIKQEMKEYMLSQKQKQFIIR